MNEIVYDHVDVALFTLSRILPHGYAKDSPIDVLRSAVQYISVLQYELQEPKIKSEPAEPVPPVVPNVSPVENSGLIELGGSEAFSILQNLGLGILYDPDTYTEMASESETKSAFNEDEKDIKPLIPAPIEKPVNDSIPNAAEATSCSYWESEAKPVPNEDIKEITPLIKRPINGFIRYSAETRAFLLKVFPAKDNRDISKRLGIMWRQLSKSEKEHYNAPFWEEISKIKAEFPQWNYAASRAKCNKFFADAHQDSVILPTRLRKRSPINYKLMLEDEFIPSSKNSKLAEGKKRAACKGENSVKLEYGFIKIEDAQNENGNFTVNVYTKTEDESLLPLKKRKGKKIKWIECELCKKWRKLPSHWKKNDVPMQWYCSLNEDEMYRSCSVPQEEH